jgi:hypothetical protein
VGQVRGFQLVHRRDAHRAQRHGRIGSEEDTQRLGLAISPDEQKRSVVLGAETRVVRQFVEVAVVAGATVHACPDVVCSFVLDHSLVNVDPVNGLRQPRLNPGATGYWQRIACRDQARSACSYPKEFMIRVASVPSSHAYVRHLQPVVGDAAQSGDTSVVVLPDPAPARVDVPGQWWPPRLLDAQWLAEQTDVHFDVLHVHFGFESFAPDELTRTVDHLRAHRQPLVLTVHDLHNPHFADNADHLRQLDVLVRAAAAVITLTAGAAAWIRERWGVEATVVDHPHVVPLERMALPRAASDSFVIGVHAKNLRSNMDPLAVMDAVVEAARSLPDATVRLDIDEAVFESSSHWYSPTVGAKLLDYTSFPDVDVRVHRRFDDDALWDYLSSIDVSVLPYRFGTHSGWLEACRDLGTSVVASDCGFYADQAHVHSFRMGIDSFDPDTLVAAVRASHADRTPAVDSDVRAEQRQRIAATHAAIYSAVTKEMR